MMRSLEKIIFISLAFALLLYPLLYWGYYAGDAMIHLVFGQNAAQGHFFEFNFGEKSSGESSVAYMLFLAVIFNFLPATLVPVAVKIANYLAWVAFLFVFYKLLKRKKFNNYIIASALFALGFLPGSVYNSMIGMENVFFALFVLLWFYFASQSHFFYLAEAPKPVSQELIFSFMLGLGTWLRLEIIPFFAITLCIKLIANVYSSRSILRPMWMAFLHLCVFILPFLGLLFFIHWQTGMWIQSSVIARTLLGGLVSHHVGSFLFDDKMIIRLLAYFPISIFWLIGASTFITVNWRKQLDEIFAIAVFLAFCCAFTFVSGVFQLSRYMIFLTPFYILIASYGLEYISKSNFATLKKYSFLSSALLFLCLIYTIETLQRFDLGNNRDLFTAINAPINKQKISDDLYAALGNPKLPVSIAGGEVDYRYLLDERFVMRCLDGRIDVVILKYFHKDSIDYLGYLKERAVNYFMADYSITSFKKTLQPSKLKALTLGQSIYIDGLRLTYIGTHFALFKIEQA